MCDTAATLNVPRPLREKKWHLTDRGAFDPVQPLTFPALLLLHTAFKRFTLFLVMYVECVREGKYEHMSAGAH